MGVFVKLIPKFISITIIIIVDFLKEGFKFIVEVKSIILDINFK
jgi:hypothetical protein